MPRMCTRSSTSRFSTAAWRPAARRTPAASYITTNEKIIAIANEGLVRPPWWPIAVVRPMTIALWLLGMPPGSASTRRFSRRCRIELRATLATWAIAQATTGGKRKVTCTPRNRRLRRDFVGTPSRQLSAEVLDSGPQSLQLLLRLVQQLQRKRVGADELFQRRVRVRKAGDRPLQAVQNVGRLGAHAMAEATRPRMPFTNRPASSPEKVLASSIDSLIAAFGGTCLSIVSS